MRPDCDYFLHGKKLTFNEFKEAVASDPELIKKYELSKSSVPPKAPFVGSTESWAALSMKRMIRWAAEHGFDRVTWDKGETQAARYDLSKQLDHIGYNTNKDGTLDIAAFDKDGKQIISEERMPLKKVEETFGKEIAEKVKNQEGELRDILEGDPESGKEYVLEGNNLKVGGEGMKGFYDEILPKTVNKLVKKWGAKVGETELSDNVPKWEIYYKGADNLPEISNKESEAIDARERGIHVVDAADTAQVAHSLDITPDMRDSVMQGQPLFQGARGKIRLATNDAKAMITLFKAANASTFMHESAHHFLDIMSRYATEEGAPDRLVSDMQKIHDYLGVKEGQEITTKQHEKFARSFERYLMEGVAPSKDLADIFAKFKKWLTDIYQTVASLRAPITDDIRDLFDRLLVKEPEKTVIAPERAEAGADFAAIHEADAAHTPPEQAAHVADNLDKEVDQIAKQKDPEAYDALKSAETVGSEEPPVRDAGTGPAAEPDAAAEGAAPEPGAVIGGRPEVAGEGGGERAAADTGGQQSAGREPSGNAATGSAGRTAEETATGGIARRGTEPEGPNQRFGPAESDLVDKAGNIRLENLNSPEDVNDVIRITAEENDNFKAARGVVTDAQVMDFADAMGMPAAEVSLQHLGETLGQGQLASKIMAARKLLIQSATEVRDAMSKAIAGSDEEVLAYAKLKARHTMIQEQLSSLTAEAGRALRAFQKMEGGEEAQALGDFLKQATGKDLFQLREEAKLGAALDTPQKVSKFINDSHKASFVDMALEFWINGLLSGPVTHVKNILGNMITAINSVPESFLTAAIGKLRGAEDHVEFGEAKARLFGIAQGAKDGVRAAWEAFKNEETAQGAMKLEQRKFQAIPSVKVNVFGKEREFGGKQVRIPGRLLTAEDELFKAIATRQELNALAYRTATKEGLKDGSTEFAQRVADIVLNPSEDMMKAAAREAEYQTFTKELGSTGKAVQKFANSHPLLKFFIPFIRTPANLLKYAGERTPLGLVSKEVRDNLSGANGEIARDTQTARMALGTMVAVAAGTMAAQGLITGGGPKDAKEKAVLYLTGWQPYSVKIGDMYYSYQWMEPFATILGVTADGVETADAWGTEEAEKIPAMIVSSIAKNLVNKTWLQGPANLIQAVDDPDRYGQQYIQQFAGSIVPSIMAQTARAQDPVMREARTIMDTIKSRVPGLSQTLLPRRDVWGEPIMREGALGPDMLSPIYQSRMDNDPVNRAIMDLNKQLREQGLPTFWPAKPDRKIRGVDLDDRQYDDYVRLSGRLTKMRLNAVVTQPGFSGVPAKTQADIIRGIVNSSRETGRNMVLMQNPDLVSKAVQNRTQALLGKKP